MKTALLVFYQYQIDNQSFINNIMDKLGSLPSGLNLDEISAATSLVFPRVNGRRRGICLPSTSKDSLGVGVIEIANSSTEKE